MVCDFHNLNGPIFEDSFVTAIQYNYEEICGLYEYENLHENPSDKMSFGSGRPLSDSSTIYFLLSLSVSIKFIDTLLKSLVYNFAWRFCAYKDKMKQLKNQLQNLDILLENLRRNINLF